MICCGWPHGLIWISTTLLDCPRDLVIQQHISKLHWINLHRMILGSVVSSDRVWGPSSRGPRLLVHGSPDLHDTTPGSSHTWYRPLCSGSRITSPENREWESIRKRNNKKLSVRERTSHISLLVFCYYKYIYIYIYIYKANCRRCSSLFNEEEENFYSS